MPRFNLCVRSGCAVRTWVSSACSSYPTRAAEVRVTKHSKRTSSSKVAPTTITPSSTLKGEIADKGASTTKNDPADNPESAKKWSSRSFAKLILAITLLGGTAYGGAVYKSLRDDEFRGVFTHSIYGADRVVDYVEYLQKQGTISELKRWASGATDSAVTIKKGETDKSKPPDGNTSTGETPGSQRISHEVDIPTAVAESLPINPFTRTINELESLKDDDLSEANIRKVITNACFKLRELADRSHIREQQFQDSIAAFEKNANDRVARAVSGAREQYDVTISKLNKQHHERLTAELSRQAERYQQQLKEELIRQAVELKRRWVREVKSKVEQERAGRLARIDYINLRLRALERISIDNAEHLDDSLKGHNLWCTLRAWQEMLNARQRTPFIKEITALRQLAPADELVKTVLSSIDESICLHGVDTVNDLRARFERVQGEVRRASLVPEDGGVFAHVISLLFSKLMFRKTGLVPGDDVEAVLSRTDHFLKQGDLDSAARELNQLKGWPKAIASDWILAARNRLEVMQAMQVVETWASLSSLSVV